MVRFIQEREVLFMYMRKSLLAGIVIAIGGIILLTLVILFGFTEIQISKTIYLLCWVSCISAVKGIVEKIEQSDV